MVTVAEVIEFLGPGMTVHRLSTDADSTILSGAAPTSEALPGEITFCRATANEPGRLPGQTRATVVIVDRGVPQEIENLRQAGIKAVVSSPNARLDFVRVLNRFFSPPRSKGVPPSAVVAPGVKLGSDVHVGATDSLIKSIRLQSAGKTCRP